MHCEGFRWELIYVKRKVPERTISQQECRNLTVKMYPAFQSVPFLLFSTFHCILGFAVFVSHTNQIFHKVGKERVVWVWIVYVSGCFVYHGIHWFEGCLFCYKWNYFFFLLPYCLEIWMLPLFTGRHQLFLDLLITFSDVILFLIMLALISLNCRVFCIKIISNLQY